MYRVKRIMMYVPEEENVYLLPAAAPAPWTSSSFLKARLFPPELRFQRSCIESFELFDESKATQEPFPLDTVDGSAVAATAASASAAQTNFTEHCDAVGQGENPGLGWF